MSRKTLFRSDQYPYHIGARVNNREHFPGGLALAWKVLSSELYVQAVLYDLRIHAFVMMPNHFHLLLTSSSVGIDKTMKEFISSSTRILNVTTCRSGRLFGARYHWSSVQNPSYYAHALKYIYRNPVKAGLVKSVADYPFSTFAGIDGRTHLPLPIRAPIGGLDHMVADLSHSEFEEWLNRPYRSEQMEGIRKALRKRVFKLPLDRKTRKPLDIGFITVEGGMLRVK